MWNKKLNVFKIKKFNPTFILIIIQMRPFDKISLYIFFQINGLPEQIFFFLEKNEGVTEGLERLIHLSLFMFNFSYSSAKVNVSDIEQPT